MIRKLVINGLVILTAMAYGWATYGDSYGTRLDVNGGEVYFTQAASEEEAQKLGEYLKNELEFFDGEERSVQLDRTGGKIIVRFCLHEGAAEDTDVQSAFRTVQSLLSSEVFGGQAVEVQLCDDYFQPEEILEFNQG